MLYYNEHEIDAKWWLTCWASQSLIKSLERFVLLTKKKEICKACPEMKQNWRIIQDSVPADLTIQSERSIHTSRAFKTFNCSFMQKHPNKILYFF